MASSGEGPGFQQECGFLAAGDAFGLLPITWDSDTIWTLGPRDARPRTDASDSRSTIADWWNRPHRVTCTDHALVKAAMLGVARTDVEDAVLDDYDKRTRNTGAADWLVVVGNLVVAFNHPDGDDVTTARVVTLWRRV